MGDLVVNQEPVTAWYGNWTVPSLEPHCTPLTITANKVPPVQYNEP